MEFPRQEYWSGLPFSTLGIFLIQGSNLCLLHLLNWQVDWMAVMSDLSDTLENALNLQSHEGMNSGFRVKISLYNL